MDIKTIPHAKIVTFEGHEILTWWEDVGDAYVIHNQVALENDDIGVVEITAKYSYKDGDSKSIAKDKALGIFNGYDESHASAFISLVQELVEKGEE